MLPPKRLVSVILPLPVNVPGGESCLILVMDNMKNTYIWIAAGIFGVCILLITAAHTYCMYDMTRNLNGFTAEVKVMNEEMKRMNANFDTTNEELEKVNEQLEKTNANVNSLSGSMQNLRVRLF